MSVYNNALCAFLPCSMLMYALIGYFRFIDCNQLPRFISHKMIVVLASIEHNVWNIFSKYSICSMNTSCKQNMSKNGQKTAFFETSWEDIFTSMLDMMIWFRMDRNDIPKCLLPQYEPPNTHSGKTLRPYSHPLIWPIFGGCFWDKWKFRQHLGQQDSVDQTFFFGKSSWNWTENIVTLLSYLT